MICFKRFLEICKCLILSILLVALLFGCGGNDEEIPYITPNPPPPPALKIGHFLDSPVAGLEYYTETQSGLTDDEGSFKYHEEETIAFFIGKNILGHTLAKPLMTPIDLVEGAVDVTDPVVTNICRFLITLDDDNDPNNNIFINPNVRQMATTYPKSINFSLSISAFESNAINMDILQALTEKTTAGIRDLVTAKDAQEHLSQTLGYVKPVVIEDPLPDMVVSLDMFLILSGLTFDTKNNLYVSTLNGSVFKLDGQNKTDFVSANSPIGGIRFSQNYFYIHFTPQYGDEIDEIALYDQNGVYIKTLVDEDMIGSDDIFVFTVNIDGESYLSVHSASDPNIAVKRIDKNGGNQTTIVSDQEGNINYATALAVDSDRDIYVAYADIVSKFSRDGDFIKKVVDLKDINGDVSSYAEALALDQNNNLYIANEVFVDSNISINILYFNSSGEYLGEFIPSGEGGFGLEEVQDMAFDHQNRLYIAEYKKVYRFNQDGSFDRIGIKASPF